MCPRSSGELFNLPVYSSGKTLWTSTTPLTVAVCSTAWLTTHSGKTQIVIKPPPVLLTFTPQTLTWSCFFTCNQQMHRPDPAFTLCLFCLVVMCQCGRTLVNDAHETYRKSHRFNDPISTPIEIARDIFNCQVIKWVSQLACPYLSNSFFLRFLSFRN